MIILAFTDIHGKPERFKKISDKLEEADLILLAGDITNFGSAMDAENIISEIEKYNRKIYAVTGNCDYPDVEKYLENKRYLVDRKIIVTDIDFYKLTGIGGSLPAPVSTPNTYTEDHYMQYLEGIEYTDIVVSHQPPYKTNADKVMGFKHVGSISLRRYIEKYNPLLCVCGHIHESAGYSMLGKTLVINPGPFSDGNYCRIIMEKSIIHEAEILKAV